MTIWFWMWRVEKLEMEGLGWNFVQIDLGLIVEMGWFSPIRLKNVWILWVYELYSGGYEWNCVLAFGDYF